MIGIRLSEGEAHTEEREHYEIELELLALRYGPKGRHLGTAIIINDGTGDKDTGNYSYTLSKFGRPKQAWKRGIIKGFERLRRGPWDLLLLCLTDALKGRNK